jgi:hypothetical protein
MTPFARFGPAHRLVLATSVLALAFITLVIIVAPRPAAGAGEPAIEFITPGGLVGGSYRLNVSITGEVDPATVMWGFGADATFAMAHASGPYYTATVPLGAVKEGDQTVMVAAKNLTGWPAASTQAIIVDNTPPEIEMLSKGGYVSGVYAVVVRVTDAHLANGTVDLSVDSQLLLLEDRSGGIFRYSLDTTALTDGKHPLKVLAEDLVNRGYAGMQPNSNSSAVVDLYVDNTPPVVHVMFDVPAYVMGTYTVNTTVTDLYINASHVWVVFDDNTSCPFPLTRGASVWQCSIDTAKDIMCGPHTVVVEVADLAGHVTRSDKTTLKVDNCPPMFMFTSETGHIMGVYNITVMVEDAFLSSAPVHAIFDGDVLGKVVMNKGADGAYYYRIDTTTLADGDHTVQATTVDLAGHVGTSERFGLKVDNHLPMVCDVAPAGNVSGDWLFYGMATDAYLNRTYVHAAIMNTSGGMEGMEMMTWTGSRFEVTIDTHKYCDGNHMVSLHACDLWGGETMGDAQMLNIDNYPPLVKIMSSGGTVWGNYKISAQITEVNLLQSSVKVKVGTADPVAMSYNTGNMYWERTINTLTLPNGEVALTVIVSDTRGNVNATEHIDVRVENRADLVITKVELDSKEVAAGGTVKARVTVRNQGHLVAKGFDIVVMAGAKTLASTTESAGLNANSDKTYVLQWKASGSGTQSLRAMVDTGNTIPEIQEGNNAASEVPLKVGAGSPGFGGAVALLAALAVGAVAIRRRR